MAGARRTRKAKVDVAALIAREIQAGLFAPGAWLKQIDLERRYGATRIEVRRALDHLVLRRLVQHEPNRGYHVRARDDAQAREVQEVRAILEVAAVDSMMRTVTDKDVKEIDALARRFSELVRNGTILEQYEANLAFHARLLRLCPNGELVGVVQELRTRGSAAPLTQWRTLARVEQSAREHEQMVEALAARDAVRLRKLIRAHIVQDERVEAEAR